MSLASRLRLAGALLALSGAAAPALAAPAERFRDLDACRIVSPTFEPSSHQNLGPGVARFLGGATVKRPVAAPCPHGPKGFDA